MNGTIVFAIIAIAAILAGCAVVAVQAFIRRKE
jgi:hypothetical protein